MALLATYGYGPATRGKPHHIRRKSNVTDMFAGGRSRRIKGIRQMGFRFRRSIRLAKGVNLNIGKKSLGISAGVRGARISASTSRKPSATVGVPGTGLSYTTPLAPKTSGNDHAIPGKPTSAQSCASGCAGCGVLFLLFVIFLVVILPDSKKDPAPFVNNSQGAATQPSLQPPVSQPPVNQQPVVPQPVPQLDRSMDTVWLPVSGKKYHRQSCRTVDRFQMQTTRGQAENVGWLPCGVCNP